MKSKSLPRLFLIKNAEIFDPFTEKRFKGEILLKNGKIEQVKENIDVMESTESFSGEEFDAKGKIVTHGFCDIHVHFREPGREDKETLFSGSQAALAGGFTTVCVMPNTNPPLDTPESIRFIVEKAENLPVNIRPVGAITRGLEGKELTEIGAMVREGAIALSDDGIPVMDGGVLRRALEYSYVLGIPVINHAEDLHLKGDGQMNEGLWSTKLGLAPIPDMSESSMISRDVQLVEFVNNGKLHVPHVTSKKSVNWIEWAKKRNLNVTADVTPHHLYFTEEALASYDTNLKVAPPLRTVKDRNALMDGLKKGIIDCIATDHAPHTIEEKEAPFDWAPCGMIGLESAFGAVWKVLSQKSFDLLEVIKKFSSNPRNIFGFQSNLFRKGTLAEIVVLDSNVEWTFTRDHIYSKSRNSPFIGEVLKGKVQHVISQGKFFFFS